MRALLTVTLLLVASFSAFADSSMALTGKVADIESEGDILKFRFTGHINFPVKGLKQKSFDLNVTNLPIWVGKWSPKSVGQGPQKFKEKDVIPSDQLREKLRTDRTLVIGIASPKMSFSDDCELTLIETDKIIVAY